MLSVREDAHFRSGYICLDGTRLELQKHIMGWIEDDKGTNCAEALFTVALFDLKQRKLILPTEAWLNALN